MKKNILFLLYYFVLGCSVDPVEKKSENDSAPSHVPIDVLTVADAVPIYEKRTRAGNPHKYEVLGKKYTVLAVSKGYKKRGIASWYGTKFHGRKTSNGEIYDMYAMTAAHKTLPIPCYVRVTNLENKRSIIVRINDRGPFHNNRVIDLSYTAAVKLGIQRKGTGFVEVEALEPNMQEAQGQTKVQQKLSSVFIQVGAFSDALNARQVQEKLLGLDVENTRVQVLDRQGKALYKVQVGPIRSVSQADNLNEKLELLGLHDTQLVIEYN